TTPDTVTLTFDDGPYDFMYNISDTLTANGTKGTFHPAIIINSDEKIKRLQYVVAQGRQMASHTWVYFAISKFMLVPGAILRITGLKSSFLRPPFGSYTESARSIAASRGQALVIWSYNSGDSKPNARSSSSVREQRSVYDSYLNAKKTTLQAYDTTAHELVPYAVTKLKAAGYKMVTLAECLGLHAYQGAPIPVPPPRKMCVARVCCCIRSFY
ncbi:carbohydrate esterase family 4 protein, partial [Hydnum rufescens UP504]